MGVGQEYPWSNTERSREQALFKERFQTGGRMVSLVRSPVSWRIPTVSPVLTICSYTKAIEVSIRKDAVFYSNRAACTFPKILAAGKHSIGCISNQVGRADELGYTNFTPPEYEKCVADCDDALELDHV